jgi:antitoxin PrlF
VQTQPSHPKTSDRSTLIPARKFLTFSHIEGGYEGGSMIRSKLTTKAQTTIPQPVREALRLKAGDELAYQIEGDRVILTRIRSGDMDDPFATFREWDSEADRTGYASL